MREEYYRIVECNNTKILDILKFSWPRQLKSNHMKNFTSLKCILIIMCFSTKAYCIPKLNSFLPAQATIYLDFDGHTVLSSSWNGGAPLFCLGSGLNDMQITEIFNRVAEDYRPFNINITTDSAKFLSAGLNNRVRIIITPTSGWTTGVGGISYVGSFTWGDDTPGFVFCDRLGPNNPKFVAECCTHESGHTVGLSHQSSYDANCNLTQTYSQGAGSGEVGWAPVMGNSYYKNMTGWNDGPTPYGCANTQDNLTIITSQNGFTYRTDDYSETRNTSTFPLGTSTINVSGIISTSTDQDAFKYVVSQPVHFHLDGIPFNVGANNAGANLDMKISLYNGNTLISTYNPLTTMGVTIDTILNPGTYYFSVDGTGNYNTSNYGSLGAYSLVGFNGPLPIHDVRLSGKTENGNHLLDWNIIADEPIKSIQVEVSTNGSLFFPLTTLGAAESKFSTNPGNDAVHFYRLKVTSMIDETAYSNTITLKSGSVVKKLFTVSTFVTNEIGVIAPENYQYRLCDANGKMLLTGSGTIGNNKININNQTSALYILQIFSAGGRQTERIIKQ